MIYKTTLKTVVFLIMSVLMIVASGCTKVKFSVDECIEYMNHKYNDKFNYIESEDDLLQSGSNMKIYVESEKIPDTPILVVEEIIDDKPIFHDNYVAVKYKQQTYDMLKEISEQVYGECRVLYDVHYEFMPDRFDDSTTFDEFISEIKSHIRTIVLLPPEHNIQNKEKELEDVYKKLCDNGMICIYEVYYTNDMEMYKSVNSAADTTLSDDWYDADGIFFMDNNFEIISLNWR